MNNLFNEEIIVDKEERIDKYLAEKLGISRTKVKEMLDNSEVFLNGDVIKKANHLTSINDKIIVEHGDEEDNFYLNFQPYDAKLDILYEDEYYLIINKPSGVLTHPTKYNENNTLVNMCLHYFKVNKINSDPWVVHRLDKDTSGLIVVAKGIEALNAMQKIFFNREVVKKYYALVNNVFKDQKVVIDVPIARSFQNKLKMNPINGKNPKAATTIVELLETYSKNSLLSCELLTGRTHQIRVHLRHINYPIVNDPLYGVEKEFSSYGQYLHAYYIYFKHPFSHKEIKIETDLPKEFSEKIRLLK